MVNINIPESPKENKQELGMWYAAFAMEEKIVSTVMEYWDIDIYKEK